MMPTTDFIQVYNDQRVTDFVHRVARRYSKRDPIFWQDLVAEGWMGIACKDAGRTHPFYCECAFKAIRNAYERNYRFVVREENALRKLLDKIGDGAE